MQNYFEENDIEIEEIVEEKIINFLNEIFLDYLIRNNNKNKKTLQKNFTDVKDEKVLYEEDEVENSYIE